MAVNLLHSFLPSPAPTTSLLLFTCFSFIFIWLLSLSCLSLEFPFFDVAFLKSPTNSEDQADSREWGRPRPYSSSFHPFFWREERETTQCLLGYGFSVYERELSQGRGLYPPHPKNHMSVWATVPGGWYCCSVWPKYVDTLRGATEAGVLIWEWKDPEFCIFGFIA